MTNQNMCWIMATLQINNVTRAVYQTVYIVYPSQKNLHLSRNIQKKVCIVYFNQTNSTPDTRLKYVHEKYTFWELRGITNEIKYLIQGIHFWV